MSESVRRRRWFSFSLRTLFVVVTVFACWLGWNVCVVRNRQSLCREIVAEHKARDGMMLNFQHGRMFVWREEHLQHRPKTVPELSRIRRWLGDRTYVWPILRNTESDALITMAAFPEADIWYYAGPWPRHGYVDMVEGVISHHTGSALMAITLSINSDTSPGRGSSERPRVILLG
jgi:hypothetical protein